MDPVAISNWIFLPQRLGTPYWLREIKYLCWKNALGELVVLYPYVVKNDY